MRDISCKLLSTTLITDSIGVQKEEVSEVEIPIIKVEEIYSNEFYEANEQGYKPVLRLRISSLNYNNEKELIYMGVTYSVIRTAEPYADEVVLICERKIKNVK
mgnify:CR=1 FL=1